MPRFLAALTLIMTRRSDGALAPAR